MTEEFYLVYDGTLNIVEDLSPIGDGNFIYKDKGKPKLATSENICRFVNGGSTNRCNDINKLLCWVWEAKYHPHYDPTRYVHVDRIYTGDGLLMCDKDNHSYRGYEHFQEHRIYNLNGDYSELHVGSMGTLLLLVTTSEGLKGSGVPVRWDERVSPYRFCSFKIVKDFIGYNVIYEYAKGKPRKGFSNVSNIIYNYISAFPDGISSRDIEKGLKMGHPTVAGRLSEMHDANRIIPHDSTKYHNKGKPNTIWRISEV